MQNVEYSASRKYAAQMLSRYVPVFCKYAFNTTLCDWHYDFTNNSFNDYLNFIGNVKSKLKCWQ